MPKVQLVVSDEQRDRWDNFVESTPETDDRSDLIRTAVERYIAEDEADGRLNDDALEDILVELDGLQSQLSTVETEVKALRTENLDEEEIENLIQLTVGMEVERMFHALIENDD